MWFGLWEPFWHLAESTLYISKPIWDDPTLKAVDKASILIHEKVYKALRLQYGDAKSERTRKIVGLLFSDLSDDEVGMKIRYLLSSPINDSVEHTSANAYDFACQIEVKNRKDERVFEDIWMGFGYGSARYVEERNFQFEVVTKGRDGMPLSISLKNSQDQSSHQMISGEDLLNSLKKGVVELKLSSRNLTAKMSCWLDLD